MDSSNSELDRSLQELSIREEVAVAQGLDPGNKNGSEMKIEVGNKREENHVNGSNKEGNSLDSRLDKIMRDAGEPELSPEQLRINYQLQADEIHIHVEVSGSVGIRAKLNSSDEHKTESSNSDGFLYSCKVKYLPPIILTCLLPNSYPSHQPPHFIMSVKWLDSARISSLCSHLDSLWTEQQGREIIIRWLGWLRWTSLSHLGFDKEITLGPYGMKHVGDERAVSGALSPDYDIPSLRSYNNERHHKIFLKETHDQCRICFNVHDGLEYAQLPCQHWFCLKCLQNFAQVHVKEGTIGNLRCPISKCGVRFPPAQLKRLLDDEAYQRWESVILEKTVAYMCDAYCPRCETPCGKDEEQHALCFKCFFSFCTLCREPRHVGTTCITLDTKLQNLQERQSSSQLKEAEKLRVREEINEINPQHERN